MPDIFISNNKPVKNKKGSPKNIPGIPNSLGMFTSFCRYPSNINFKDQEDNEQILLFIRRHFITNVFWIIFGIFLFCIPIFLLIFNLSFSAIPPQYQILILAFYYLIVFNYFFVNFITWFYNISLVTDQRIVDVDYSDLVYKNVASTKIDLVQDVDYTQTGVLRSVFNYGDVFLQTASEKANFDFLAIPNPESVSSTVENLIGK